MITAVQGPIILLDVRMLSATTAVLAVNGRLNAVTVPAFKARVNEVIGHGRPKIVCDLTGVTFLDSSGLAGLILALKATTERGGFLKFVAVNDLVRRMFRLTHLDRVFELHSSVEAVLAGTVDAHAIPRAA
jgi:anti-sigma B factor antagonist